MNQLNQVLLILHFLGLALGFSVSFSTMVMGGLIRKASPADKAVLGRFPPVMSHVGSAGLVLLWVTGLILTFTKWGGFGSLPGTFHAKLTAVVLLTIAVGMSHRFQKQLRLGDQSAAARLDTTGKVITLLAIAAVVLAVMTFD
ncbi:MAG: hypothetical protein R2745_17500 [Vicinamibacterales bacterium]